MKTNIIEIRTGKPMQYQDLAKPLPKPRLTLVFREAYKGRYAPVNGCAKIFRNGIGRGLYISEHDLAWMRNFVNIEVK